MREQTASSGGDSGNDGPSTTNSSVSDVTDRSGVGVGSQLTVETDHETETNRKARFFLFVHLLKQFGCNLLFDI